jgi:hypothetical protein
VAGKQAPAPPAAGGIPPARGPPPNGVAKAATAEPPPQVAAEELLFWQDMVRTHKNGSAAAGRQELLAMAEAKVEHLLKEAKACRPLGARSQAAQSRVDKERKATAAADAALEALCTQIAAALTVQEAAEVRLAEALTDLKATRLELAEPVIEDKASQQAELVRACVEAMVAQGLITVAQTGPAFLQAVDATTAAALKANLEAKAAVEPGSTGAEAQAPKEEMEVDPTELGESPGDVTPNASQDSEEKGGSAVSAKVILEKVKEARHKAKTEADRNADLSGKPRERTRSPVREVKA